MKGFLSKVFVLIFFLLSTFYFLSSATPISAASETGLVKTNVATTSSVNSDVPNNLHNWTQTVMIEVMSSLSCQLTGIDPTMPDKQCLGVDAKTGKIGFLPAGNAEKGQIGGAIGGMTNMITMLYTPPLHTSDYFQNLAQNFGISKQVYAQTGGGRGFQELQPLMRIWTVFRDIVYFLLVIVFVVIGLGVTLRLKIDPRTVMSIQNQIPKFIVGLLLVTFSFAIAGFLVDLMWVSTYTVINTFSDSSNVSSTLLQGNPFKVVDFYGGFDKITIPPATAGKELLQSILGIKTDWAQYIPFVQLNPLGDIANFIAHPETFIPTLTNLATNPASVLKFSFTGFPSLTAGSPINFVIDLTSAAGSALWFDRVMSWDTFPFLSILGNTINLGFIGKLPLAGYGALAVYPVLERILREGLPWLIIWLILTIAVLISLFRLWFMLIVSYVMILVDVVLAPFWIIGGILPGSPISFTAWLRDIAANLLAFPAVIFMFCLGKLFMNGFEHSGTAFMPPLIGDATGDTTLFGSLIAIGVILMTPNVVNMLKQILKAPKMDTGIGKAIGVGTGTLTSPFRFVLSGLSMVAGTRVADRIPFLKPIAQEARRGAAQEETPRQLPGESIYG